MDWATLACVESHDSTGTLRVKLHTGSLGNTGADTQKFSQSPKETDLVERATRLGLTPPSPVRSSNARPRNPLALPRLAVHSGAAPRAVGAATAPPTVGAAAASPPDGVGLTERKGPCTHLKLKPPPTKAPPPLTFRGSFLAHRARARDLAFAAADIAANPGAESGGR